MRILIGSVEISGIGRSLSRGFAKLGHEAHLVTSISHPFDYGGELSSTGVLAAWQRLGDISVKSRNKLVSFGAKLLGRAIAFLVLAWAVFRYDAFIYLFGCTLTRTRLELMLLRWLGKKIIFVYVGSDVRPAYMCGSILAGRFTPEALREINRQTHRSFRRMRLQERYADYIVNAPATAMFGSRPYVNWFALGLPVVIESGCQKPNPDERQGRIRILHSPSNPVAKGSAIVEEAIQNLIAKGYEIDFVQLTGVSNDTVLDELSRCDFVVDQVYSDTPMATFAAEAASKGVPSVVAGYFSAHARRHIDPENLPPSLYVTPDDLQNAIEKMITDPVFRRDLGNRAKHFVQTKWSPEGVAANYLRLLEGDVPDQWMHSPYEIDYFKGAALSELHLKQVVVGLTETYGSKALCLDDKPELRDGLLSFARRQ